LSEDEKEAGEEGTLSEKDRQALLDGLLNLPTTHAHVIILYYLRSIELDQIAKVLGLPLSEVHKIHYDTLVRLKLRFK